MARPRLTRSANFIAYSKCSGVISGTGPSSYASILSASPALIFSLALRMPASMLSRIASFPSHWQISVKRAPASPCVSREEVEVHATRHQAHLGHRSKDGQARRVVGKRGVDELVETARMKQRRVDLVIHRAEDEQVLLRVHAIHFHVDLVEDTVARASVVTCRAAARFCDRFEFSRNMTQAAVACDLSNTSRSLALTPELALGRNFLPVPRDLRTRRRSLRRDKL